MERAPWVERRWKRGSQAKEWLLVEKSEVGQGLHEHKGRAPKDVLCG